MPVFYVLIFGICSVFGWVYECCYCTWDRGHWQNRGFLYGPVCPIYGFGGLAIAVVSNCFPAVHDMSRVQVFGLFAAGSAVLEYITSWALEKWFHARWWDYSRMPLNLNGRICLPASVLFGLMGILGLDAVLPFLHGKLLRWPRMVQECMALFTAMVFGADLALSVSSMTQLLQHLEEAEERLNERMEKRVQMAKQIPEVLQEAKESLEKSKERALLQARAIGRLERHHLGNVRLWKDPAFSQRADVLKKRK